MKVLVIDIGGTHVKLLVTGQKDTHANSLPAPS